MNPDRRTASRDMVNSLPATTGARNSAGPPQVDIVVNTFERTYRRTLSPAYWTQLIDQHRFPFARRVALINNVANPAAARSLAEALVQAGKCDSYHEVMAELPAALQRTRMQPSEMARLPHYTDCCLVAVCLPGSEYLLYWDADAMLEQPFNWIAPSVALLRENSDIAVCNPSWAFPQRDLPMTEARRLVGPFALGFGFSDTAFLCRRSEFAAPIYKYSAPASWRYPLAETEKVFEQRVDSYMRRKRRLRATFLPATYIHDAQAGIGRAHPSLRVRLIRTLRMHLLAAFGRVFSSPALRVNPRRLESGHD